MNKCDTNVMSQEAAELMDYPVYGGGPHICLDLPDETCTVSINTPDGNQITFCFIHRPEGKGHQCVDIVHHSGILNKDGNHLQKAAFLGQGPTVAVTKPDDETPTTLVVVQLPKK